MFKRENKRQVYIYTKKYVSSLKFISMFFNLKCKSKKNQSSIYYYKFLKGYTPNNI